MSNPLPTANAITEAGAIATLAAAATQLQTLEGRPFAVVPEGYELKDLGNMLPAPVRKAGTVQVRDVASLLAMLGKHGSDNTTIYGQLHPAKFTIIFNDHAATPGWADHRAVYTCPLSIEWTTWTGSHKKEMTQADFAQFIEDNAPDIMEPASGEMIEIARSIEAKKQVNFASAIRLSNGQTEFTYEEQIEGTAAKGKLKVPDAFKIAVPVFENSPHRNLITARLRYRIGQGGKLAMWYDLERHHKDHEAATRDVWASIEAQSGLTIINAAI